MREPHLVLTEKLAELDAYSHNVLHQFPRMEKFILSAAMRITMREMQRLSVVAWKRKQKSAALFDLDVQIELFRRDIRKAHGYGYINDRRLDIWMRHVNEIGNLVGGWIKHEREKEEAAREKSPHHRGAAPTRRGGSHAVTPN